MLRMRKDILFGLGLAVLLILGFWGWQSGFESGNKLPKPSTSPRVRETSEEREAPSVPSPIPSATDSKQNGSGSVSGTVRLKSSQPPVEGAVSLKSTQPPVAGAVVQARNTEKKFESDLVSTDEKGSYTLTGLPTGIRLYLIHVEGPTEEYYQDRGGVAFSLKPGEQRTGVNLKLSQGQPG
jgi:cytoskeletal protein RodZ